MEHSYALIFHFIRARFGETQRGSPKDSFQFPVWFSWSTVSFQKHQWGDRELIWGVWGKNRNYPFACPASCVFFSSPGCYLLLCSFLCSPQLLRSLAYCHQVQFAHTRTQRRGFYMAAWPPIHVFCRSIVLLPDKQERCEGLISCHSLCCLCAFVKYKHDYLMMWYLENWYHQKIVLCIRNLSKDGQFEGWNSGENQRSRSSRRAGIIVC